MSEGAAKSAAQASAEADVESVRQELGPFVVAAETTRMAMVFTDAKVPDHPIVFANDSFLKLTGYDREEALGCGFRALIGRRADPEALAHIEKAFEDSAHDDPEVCLRGRDGAEFWASVMINPVRDEHGETVQHFISFADITRHRARQTQAKMLIDELNHRVKNTLATVQSIVAQAARRAPDPAFIREAIEGRVFALSRSHDLLTRENWEGAGLRDIVDAALEPFGVANGRAERFTITGENVRLPPKAALALGIAFHELATNAVKYGAFSNAGGCILIDWAIVARPATDRLILTWRETDGPPVAPPSHRGFGSRVLERGLAHELSGVVSLEYRREGVICTIDIPMPGAANDG